MPCLQQPALWIHGKAVLRSDDLRTSDHQRYRLKQRRRIDKPADAAKLVTKQLVRDLYGCASASTDSRSEDG